MKKLLALLPPILLMLEGCPAAKAPEDQREIVVFPPYGDAGNQEVDVSADCRVACENLAKMGCPESVPAGRSCGSVCTTAQARGIDLRTICVANASTPDQVRACGTADCRGR